jgi:hypothetical protein
MTSFHSRPTLKCNNILQRPVRRRRTSYHALSAYLSSLSFSSGHTYIATNGIDTFVVTDYASHIGAIEIVGAFTGTVANHVLTLANAV